MALDIRRDLRKFTPHFLQAREAGLNEADTVQRLCRFFETVLGYDGIADISREAQLKNKYVDIALKIDGNIRLLVEAKAAGHELRDRHIEQAQAYASQNNYRWVVLTNGVDWHLYHLTFEEGIEYERAFVISLATEDGLDAAAGRLCLLHKRAIGRGDLEEFWEKEAALCPASIAKALFSEDVLALIRRGVRRDTGLLIDQEDLAESLKEMLSPEAREQIGTVRIRRRRRPSKAIAGAAELKPRPGSGPSPAGLREGQDSGPMPGARGKLKP